MALNKNRKLCGPGIVHVFLSSFLLPTVWPQFTFHQEVQPIYEAHDLCPDDGCGEFFLTVVSDIFIQKDLTLTRLYKSLLPSPQSAATNPYNSFRAASLGDPSNQQVNCDGGCI